MSVFQNFPPREFIGEQCGVDQYEKHEWTKYEACEEGGLMVITRGKRIGHWETFSKSWQERICNKCGVVDRSPDVSRFLL